MCKSRDNLSAGRHVYTLQIFRRRRRIIRLSVTHTLKWDKFWLQQHHCCQSKPLPHMSMFPDNFNWNKIKPEIVTFIRGDQFLLGFADAPPHSWSPAAAELNDSNLSAEGNHLQNIMIVTQCRMSMQDLKIIPNQLSSALLRKHFIKLFRFNIILTFI